MGLFLQTILFPDGSALLCRSKLQAAAQNRDFAIDLNGCRWHVYEKGPAVLMNDGCCGYEDLAKELSTALSGPVMMLFVYDGDYWGYFLWEKGAEIDRFQALPNYFGAGSPPDRPGNAALVAGRFGVERETIERYLLPWDKEAMGSRAYEGDTATIGDCWQIADFMDALGFDYDLLDPQPEVPAGPPIPQPPHQTAPAAASVVVPRPSGPLPDSEELPDALTSRPYALERAEEVEDIAPEAVELIRDMGYQSAVPLLTAAIQAHPDRAALHILRAFCWSQLEGLASGVSRKPDMDRDLSKALEEEPDNVMILRARCPTTATTTRYKRHIEDLTRLMALDPDHWDTYLTSRAYRFHWVGDDASAKADLAELVRRGARLTVDLSYLLREFGMM